MLIEEPSKRIISGGKLKGQASAVFGYLRILEETKPIDNDDDHWTLRAYLLANDQDKQGGDLPLLAGLLLRRN